MIIVRDYPPMFPQIVKAFPEAASPGALFTWGNRIYNPSRVQIPRELLVHEEVHHQRQGEEEAGIVAWWQRYLVDAQFRLDEELPAHIAEYKAFRGGRHGFSRKGMLHHIASRLASPFYGGLVTYQEAVKLITEAP
jgi:hypothetical protein